MSGRKIRTHKGKKGEEGGERLQSTARKEKRKGKKDFPYYSFYLQRSRHVLELRQLLFSGQGTSLVVNINSFVVLLGIL